MHAKHGAYNTESLCMWFSLVLNKFLYCNSKFKKICWAFVSFYARMHHCLIYLFTLFYLQSSLFHADSLSSISTDNLLRVFNLINNGLRKKCYDDIISAFVKSHCWLTLWICNVKRKLWWMRACAIFLAGFSSSSQPFSPPLLSARELYPSSGVSYKPPVPLDRYAALAELDFTRGTIGTPDFFNCSTAVSDRGMTSQYVALFEH